MLASSVVHVHLAAAVPCSRARRPSPVAAALADVYAAALANACRTWKLRSAREPTGLRPLGMPVYPLRLRDAAAKQSRSRVGYRFGRAETSALPVSVVEGFTWA